MEEEDTDRLIADLLAVTVRVNQLLKAENSLTALQRDCLINAIGNLNTFFAIWKMHYSTPQDSTPLPCEPDA
jgi:hypothetical protein